MHAAEKSDAKPSPVSVSFFQPEKFTDVRDSMIGSDKGRDAILEELRRFITTRAESLLPPGHTLSMTFLDVDLAGDYEFWRGPNMQDVRIVKDIYPPRFLFRFEIKDADGKVLGSLGGIMFGYDTDHNRNYPRVVEAELALEALHEKKLL